MFADEKRVEAGSAQTEKIVVRAGTRFADGDTMFRGAVDQFQGSFRAHRQRFQVAIVYADDASSGGQGAIEFGGRVNFHQSFHAQLAAELEQVAELRTLERGDDEQKAVGIIGASFPDLPGIKDEILAEHREMNGFAGITQILKRAVEKFLFGEDGKRGGASGFESVRQSDSVKGV